jgi:hypothetical protein
MSCPRPPARFHRQNSKNQDQSRQILIEVKDGIIGIQLKIPVVKQIVLGQADDEEG